MWTPKTKPLDVRAVSTVLFYFIHSFLSLIGMRDLFLLKCCSNYITQWCFSRSHVSLRVSPLSLPKKAIHAISLMVLMTLPGSLATEIWTRVCVATAGRIVTRVVRCVLQVQMGPLGRMTMVLLFGDVRAQILLGKTRHAWPLLTVKLSFR